MCRLATAFLFAPLFLVLALAPIRPKVSGTGASFSLAPDSTVNATVTVTVRGTLQSGDFIRYKVKVDTGYVANKLAPPYSYAFTGLPAPAYGATFTYYGCARVQYANGSQSGEVCSTAGWVYTRPSAPPATIDSVRIRPDTAVALQGGASYLVPVTSYPAS